MTVNLQVFSLGLFSFSRKNPLICLYSRSKVGRRGLGVSLFIQFSHTYGSSSYSNISPPCSSGTWKRIRSWGVEGEEDQVCLTAAFMAFTQVTPSGAQSCRPIIRDSAPGSACCSLGYPSWTFSFKLSLPPFFAVVSSFSLGLYFSGVSGGNIAIDE